MCPNIHPNFSRVKVRTRFPHADSFRDNRPFIRGKDVLQISTHCFEAFAPEAVRSKGIPSCPNLEPKIRSLSLICPNLRPIYQPTRATGETDGKCPGM